MTVQNQLYQLLPLTSTTRTKKSPYRHKKYNDTTSIEWKENGVRLYTQDKNQYFNKKEIMRERLCKYTAKQNKTRSNKHNGMKRDFPH